jgi:hypothetical protein
MLAQKAYANTPYPTANILRHLEVKVLSKILLQKQN